MPMLLIVEDNRLFLSTLRTALSLRFPALECDEAENRAAALLILEQRPPDLALLDICLPDGSGLELAAKIMLDWPGIPIAICTSHDLPEYREAAKRIGVSSFLVKQQLDWNELDAFINRPSAPRARASLRGGSGRSH